MELQTFKQIRKLAITLDPNSGATIHPLFTYTPFTSVGYKVLNESMELTNIKIVAYIHSLPLTIFPVFDLTDDDSTKLLAALNLEWKAARIQVDTLVQTGIGAIYQRLLSNSLTNPDPYPYKEFSIDNQSLGVDDMLGFQIRNVGFGLLQNSNNGTDTVTIYADLATTITISALISDAQKVVNSITSTASSIVNANTQRQGITFQNTSDRVVYLDVNSSVSPISNMVALNPTDYWEPPVQAYTGAYYAVGVGSSAAGIDVREFS